MSCAIPIKIEPCNATWEIEEKWEVTCVADVSSSLNNKYFLLWSGSNAGFYVWFNVASAGVDPAVAGKTAIPVAIAANASAATVAAAVQVAVDANANFVASVSGATVTIVNADAGDADDMEDGAAPTGFSFTQCQDGGVLDLGYLDGDIEITFEEQSLDVTAHQTGTTLLASLRQGVVAEVGLTMKEADFDKYKEVFKGTAGATYTPSGGTEVFGWGSSKLGLNTVIQARRLVLHPVVLSGSDKSRDLCFWKAYPLVDTMTISGENPRTLSMSFKTYKDTGKPAAIDQFVFGDWSQSEFVP